METVIVAFENTAMGQKLGELLESTGTARCILCQSGDQVRRWMDKQGVLQTVLTP